ncbi:MAG: DNA-directed RNA polymerase subunit omega [Clostridia bacterium]|nr:DNA-directed RNA polymerase subunit omega [Clostridia bacterium]
MVKPAVTELLKIVPDRYSLVIMTSKRARQIASGATVLTGVDEKSAVTLAVNEISEGKVTEIEE